MAGFFDIRFWLLAVLVGAVIFVNGWTDAPSAIATAVASGAIKLKRAALMAAVFNMLGIATVYLVNDSVSQNIMESVSIKPEYSLAALCAAMISIIAFAVAAWYFGIPTSEGHALMASLSGAAAACGDRFRLRFWGKVGFGIVATTVLGFFFGFLFYKALYKRKLSRRFLKRAQVLSAALLAFMHGAQDGQKFTAVLLLSLSLSGGATLPRWAAVLFCGVFLSLGTALGGGRIIKRIGSITKVDECGGVCCDISAFISLLICTLTGIPVSTTHSKTTAVLGVGVSQGYIRLKSYGGMAFTWIITFPVCFLLAFFITKLCI